MAAWKRRPGAEAATTNNREELKAVREALRAVRRRIGTDPSWRIVVRTDSLGAVNWLPAAGSAMPIWTSSPGSTPWSTPAVAFEHVRGHAGDAGDERVNTLAVAAIRATVRQLPA